jgi:hypothetical protein
MGPKEAILASDCPSPGSKQRCFGKKQRSSFRKCPFQPLIDPKMPFPLPEITGDSSVTAGDRQVNRAVDWGEGEKWRGDPGIKPGSAQWIFLGARFGEARPYAQNSSSGFCASTYRDHFPAPRSRPGEATAIMRGEGNCNGNENTGSSAVPGIYPTQ